jgi:large subunit ribosomal protein L16
MKLKKYKKYHTNKNIYKIEKIRSCVVKQGVYGVKAVNQGILTPKQVEAARRVISRVTKRSATVLILLNFEHPLTKKPLLTRMGRGCGIISE